ncbi:maintenance of telomere capping protein 1 [Bombardia bombarda]|uniref:Maintenance of telomere capping protein 1 n=1 Tax=Bombardia bombarda TaxID=252184 RepID=A0AA39XBB4_9PEZI|nr:maintenance of telomere capping protein 1 [Bombardia bombarda]
MASKRAKPAPADDDDFDDLFKDIEDSSLKKTDKPKAKPSAAKGKPDAAAAAAEQDILAELENQLGEKAPDRPHTPRIRDVAAKSSPIKRTSTNTPPPPPTSADNNNNTATTLPLRKSVESTRSYHASFTPSATSSELQESERKAAAEQPQSATASGGGGGWWGGLLSTATAAMKQAEAAVKEMQQNEEAKKWAEQVRGINVGALKGLGDELRHRALPTFTNILHTLAPPISSHERLLIHIAHDLVGYPSLDPLIHAVFSRVMAQVEGGDLLVIQRGQESGPSGGPSSSGQPFFSGGVGQSTAGWHDGPWWRQSDIPRDLGLVGGLVEGTKLCRASAEGYATDYLSHHGGIDFARQRAIEPLSESNPVRSSDLFLSVQAIAVPADKGLFAGSSASEKEKEMSPVLEDDSRADVLVCFAVFILDPVHEIQYSAVSQSIPAKWIHWLDAAALPLTPASGEDGGEVEFERVPEEIRDILEAGGVDPREWVAEWVEEVLSLSVGVVAQSYVARRMGVGEGGIGRGKQKMESVLEDGGSEAARAGLI